MHYTYFKRRMEECLKSGIKLLLIFVLSHSLARHSILLKTRLKLFKPFSGHICLAIKNQNAAKDRELCGILFQNLLNIGFRSFGVRRKQNWVYKWHSSLDCFLSLSLLPCSFSFLALYTHSFLDYSHYFSYFFRYAADSANFYVSLIF